MNERLVWLGSGWNGSTPAMVPELLLHFKGFIRFDAKTARCHIFSNKLPWKYVMVVPKV